MKYIPLALFIFSSLAFPSDDQALVARVDPRVELMSLIFRLSGTGEYNQPQSMSPYSRAAAAHFDGFSDHPVVRAAKELKSTRGVSYDAVMAMALHIQDTIDLEEKIPFDQAPERLGQRWVLKDARDFLEKARDFVKKSGFNDFIAAHQELYEQAAERMTAKLGERAYLGWFDEFFGSRPGAKFSVIVGMLNGPCNYGMSVRYPDGSEEITPVLGAQSFDAEGIPVFTDSIVTTVAHEFCHTYTNAFVDRYAGKLVIPATRIFAQCSEVMTRQAYGNWQTMMYETLVRACVVRYLDATDGKNAAEEEIKRQYGRGFKWVGDLSKLFAVYERKRDRYPDFDSFMPEVVEFINGYSEKYKGLAALAPKVVSMIPRNGATDVDPHLTEIKVFFDRPMRDRGWAVCGSGPNYPESAGDCSYDKECKVFTFPVRLKPDWSYKLWLNYDQYDDFKSKEGVPLESVAVTFKTRKEK